MSTSDAIELLEFEWGRDEGFFGKLRDGEFDKLRGQRVLNLLSNLTGDRAPTIDRRLVSLLWYIPLYMQWQEERVVETGGDIVEYKQLCDKVLNMVQAILGVP